MGMFFRTRMPKENITDGGIYTGALFFTVIIVMFNGMSEISMTIKKLSVFYKQRDMFFFPPWAYGLPAWFLNIPFSLIEVGIWTGLTHYVIGLDPNAGRYPSIHIQIYHFLISSTTNYRSRIFNVGS